MDLKTCIDNCTQCHRVCLDAALYAMQQRLDTAHVRLLLDCAEICQTSANFMLRRSPLHSETCGVCAQICRRCAEACAGMSDDVMRRCAEMCQRCAESCGEMSRMTA
jgi:hypothetical protein